ncbi:hypothetical protein UNSW3_1323 [Campylobacter concisus UNSW3]|uniref:Uncharacterized protein n=1 Tax=Campylobacter concisus UNSW3 TaxID=1242966 RepID=U2FZ18_9BACT|nr:hypothetical protein UNSW3_1323 [Campylobacter concisus UNSW3]
MISSIQGENVKAFLKKVWVMIEAVATLLSIFQALKEWF